MAEVRARRWVALALAAALALACGGEPSTGPGRVAWDRDACERCRMAIGDRHFAAQVREPGGALYRFDDLGCALLWLDEHPEADAPGAEIWVRSASGDDWVAARDAAFREGAHSPMGYGFAAVAGGEPGLGLGEVRARVRARDDARRSPAH